MLSGWLHVGGKISVLHVLSSEWRKEDSAPEGIGMVQAGKQGVSNQLKSRKVDRHTAPPLTSVILGI